MDNHSEPIPLFSPTTARMLWIVTVAFAGCLLALNLWGWARREYAWTTFLGPVGILLLMISYPLIRSRGRLYLALQVMAMGLLIADLILILQRL